MSTGGITEAKRKRARQILAFDGMWYYARQEMGDEKFHRFLNEKIEEVAATLPDLEGETIDDVVESKSVFVPDKKPRINQTYLRFTVAPGALNQAYLGTKNMDVPANVFRTLNDDEKIALLIGGWKLKYIWGRKYVGDGHEISRDYDRNRDAFVERVNEELKAGISECFYDLVGQCLRSGYSVLNSSRIETVDFHYRKQRQNKHKAPLKDRFETIPEEDKLRFIDSMCEDIQMPSWKRNTIWYGDFLSAARKWDKGSRTYVYDQRRLAKLIYDYVLLSC